ncbi:N-acetyltransferase [Collibacillus ludicampi]|jgi:UDP-2,4-diacetamido-2,4,6-trideoxy-beta-L-altropyranose hydrolase|uniref:N-acetyltransferase n=1 Tax=Collibacillus ludicampi TaxID=2771369 RepID=A0AAV4LF96_9BACL|nr:GNAT family N-acetyltransferase [Collibacillus ludicampi]GIM46480.1 N-acetyltransferase [Collibacillus ludicampi]
MFVCREAEWKDCNMILDWRNDPVTRINSLDSREISQEEHEAWFRRSLSLPDRILFIIEKDHVAIGVLRFDQIDEKRMEVSIHLAPEARNRGYGQNILKMSCELARTCRPQIQTLVAKIKKENLLSIKSFTKAGFRIENEGGNLVYMFLDM